MAAQQFHRHVERGPPAADGGGGDLRDIEGSFGE
jgi:hypothetical protein